jgi:hypothetical protein
MTPFDFLNAINTTKEDLIVDDITEKQYNAFMVNRGLSYFPDTIILANEMNKLYHLDNKLQNSFYINIVRKRKRFSKWFKADTSDSLNAVKEYYGYSTEKARQVLSILSSDQISEIKNKVSHGGK